MRVEEIMSTHLETCRAEDSLQAVAQSMWDHDIGLLPVVTADGRLTSVITDRDVAMGACICGRALRDIKVSEVMPKRWVVTLLPSDDLQRTAERMRAEQIHRVPVIDRTGILRGIITINDLARHVRSRRLNGVTPEEVTGTVAAISAPRAAASEGPVVAGAPALGAAAPTRAAPAGGEGPMSAATADVDEEIHTPMRFSGRSPAP